ncbi:hypothetical protein BJ878DRAFT_480382 [Calycina marina]|uniref:Uncharacterized protein n=1 Tax=Calycina marina TaxID=1763456 RepID=A0A9P7Z2H1_9HELO|nr:hypothetical protein BJ878DRAFT_480382 [Calycina marina]
MPPKEIKGKNKDPDQLSPESAPLEGESKIPLTFLEPTLDAGGNLVEALDLVEEVVSFLSNPHEQQTAGDNYHALHMRSGESFWEFYHKFGTLASTARKMDVSILKMDLRDKLLPRLRRQLHSEYKNTRTLKEWVAEFQAEDQGQTAKRTVYANQYDYASGKRSTPNSLRHL